MTANSDPTLDRHNREQKEYFKVGEKKRTMLPEDTPYNRKQAGELVRFGGLTPGQRILEVGCGMGRHAFALAQLGLRVEGLDLSPELLERFRFFNAGRYDIPLYCGDILEFAAELGGRFDAVVGFFVLHHLQDLPAYFSAMAGMLKPDGRLVFVEPNPLNLLYYPQILFTPGMAWRAEKGILDMRRDVIFPAMRQAGLDNLRAARFGFFPRFVANLAWGMRLETSLEKVSIWNSLLPFQLFLGERS